MQAVLAQADEQGGFPIVGGANFYHGEWYQRRYGGRDVLAAAGVAGSGHDALAGVATIETVATSDTVAGVSTTMTFTNFAVARSFDAPAVAPATVAPAPVAAAPALAPAPVAPAPESDGYLGEEGLGWDPVSSDEHAEAEAVATTHSGNGGSGASGNGGDDLLETAATVATAPVKTVALATAARWHGSIASVINGGHDQVGAHGPLGNGGNGGNNEAQAELEEALFQQLD